MMTSFNYHTVLINIQKCQQNILGVFLDLDCALKP